MVNMYELVQSQILRDAYGIPLCVCCFVAASVTSTASSNSATFTEAKSAVSNAVSAAVAATCKGGDVQAAAEACAKAVASAAAKAFSQSSASVTVKGGPVCRAPAPSASRLCQTGRGHADSVFQIWRTYQQCTEESCHINRQYMCHVMMQQHCIGMWSMAKPSSILWVTSSC